MSSNEANEETETQNDANGVDVLSSKPLNIMSKRYYVDVKQIEDRKFIKLVESQSNGAKNRLTIPMPLVSELKEKLSEFITFYEKLEPRDKEEIQEEEKLKSDIIRGLGKRFYLDLKENHRGWYLRISQAAKNRPRSTIAIPGSGMSEVRDALLEVLEEHGSDDAAALSDESVQLPEAEELKVERKRFYFDCGQNPRGIFLRISEVTNEYRSSVTIPREGLAEFAEVVGKLADSLQV